MQFVKIRGVYINMALVSDVQVGIQSAEITFAAVDSQMLDNDSGVSVSKVIVLRGKEAMALKWWLDQHCQDALVRYENAIDELNEDRPI